MANQRAIERKIFNLTLQAVHSGSTRLRDSGQKALHAEISKNIQSTDCVEIVDQPNIEARIANFVKELEEYYSRVGHGKQVNVRKKRVNWVLEILNHYWPFGG